MKLDVTRILKNLDDKPLKGDDGKDLTLGKACVTALMAMEPNKPVDGNEKFLRGELAMRIHRAKKYIDLKVEETAKIKKRIGVGFGPLLIVQVWEILEKKKE